MEHISSEKAVFYFFLSLFFASLVFAGRLVIPFLPTIALGFVVTGIFAPLYRLLGKKITPVYASAITCVAIFFVVFVPVMLFIGVLSKEAYDLYLMGKNAVLSNQLKQLLENTQALDKLNALFATLGLNISFSWEELIKPISELGKVVGMYLFQQASFIASNIFKVVFYFCLMLVVVFYLLIDGKRFLDYLYDLSPLPDEHNDKLFSKFKEMAGAILVGNGLGGLIQGSCGGLLFLISGLSSPVLWGVIMGFLAFLPIVGIGIVLLPMSLFFMLKQKMTTGIIFLVVYAVLSWGIEYVFKPKVVGDRVRMHPLIVFFAIIGGLNIYGILGIIYGPLIVTLFLTLADIYFATFQVLVEPERVRGIIKKDSQ